MNKKLFIMGAPNAGKSTFLAALWHSVNQKDVRTDLTLERMAGNVNYLQGIEKKWLEVDKLGRTVIGQEQENLTILLAKEDMKLELEFPDLSGETFRDMYDKREISNKLKQKIENADSILYFVNVSDIHTAELISEIDPKYRSEGQKQNERKASEDDPTQVQMIDLLQAILDIKKDVKLAIIFSAWDLVDSIEHDNVDLYLKKHMNMLWQYLHANKNVYHTKLWGVSALGGKIDESEKLLDIEEPIKRIEIINDKREKSCDLTSIILEMSGEL